MSIMLGQAGKGWQKFVRKQNKEAHIFLIKEMQIGLFTSLNIYRKCPYCLLNSKKTAQKGNQSVCRKPWTFSPIPLQLINIDSLKVRNFQKQQLLGKLLLFFSLPIQIFSDGNPQLPCSQAYYERVQKLLLICGRSRQNLQGKLWNGKGRQTQMALKLTKAFFLFYKLLFQVIPPPEWKPRSTSYNEALHNLNVNGPIEQNIFGKGGVYECLHIQKKSMTLEEYKLKTGVFDKITKNLSPQEVQQMFWKNIVFSPPLYGADLLNTLMDEKAGGWNLGNLNSLLRESMETKVKGVNTPYCYIGSWKTLFCWHKEDLDLSAINYLHDGKSKFWYSVPESQGPILEKQAKRLFPDHFAKCNQFLRHKTTLINPYLLKRSCPELKFTKIEHKKNQFMLIFGGAYHCGFNFGCNIAEAVNYGTIDWLRQVIDSKACTCSKNSVRASSIEIYKNLSKTQIAKTPEFSQFQKRLFAEVEAEESEEDENDIKAIKCQFTKKIKKNSRKKVQKIKYKGDEYDIDCWALCDKCKLWRKTDKKYQQNETFMCRNAGKKCYTRQKIAKSYITLN